jgi:glutaredoxin-related protein
MTKPILYTTHCPACKVLTKKLISANIDFEECTDNEIMNRLKIDAVPVLEVDGKLLSLKQAVEWINERG